jgi:hypothetical protein
MVEVPGSAAFSSRGAMPRIRAALEHAIADTAPATATDRVLQTHACFQHRTPAQQLTTAAPWISPWLPTDDRQDLRQRASCGARP